LITTGSAAVAPSPAIRAVLFDKDGTLFDFFATWVPAYEIMAARLADGDAELARHLLEAAGHDPSIDRIDPRSLLASGTNRQIAEVWAGLLGRSDLAALEAELNVFFTAHGSTSAQPVTDLPALFRRLKLRGLALGLATMDSHAAADAAIAVFGLTGLLDFFTGYDTGHGAKPGPGMVEGFCRAVGLPAENVAVVGDTLHDMEMARAAGAGLAVGVLTGATPREVLEPHADHVLGSIADLETLLG
jgi:phosphoglycolate phosphatase